ncbi:aminotransferase class III-fold pyridoxal phosphate-dependent enzyme [Streptomyces phaeoluteigriseus]|uniref:Aminotransferase class III-fold pyridoxal phosphate-dependent enzyme n=1 Tax=Streptomyces phaeoluteigriseus TaxID=114686 RepID=A0ABY4ZB68_9ACTN|nr:aminotransferase class III-fold pyridoxal phosphate-dependent enzyme [Streptomyces phaeoluteigriseus]USQ85760.1 aminotransferase class III-fold pyridoxal phosphate-dependent enzyme [Streptomyces phaeoluteigriseus]
MPVNESSLFHLETLNPLRRFAEALAGSCLDPHLPSSEGEPRELVARNPDLFTQGGSWPRDVWVTGGLGATLDTVLVDTGDRQELIDLCTILTVLGINDPWVKLKQLTYLLSRSPHHVTIRLGCDMYYRVARRILKCFDRLGEPGDYVINMRQCNGSDAVELALHAAWKAARESPSRRRLGTFLGSYHGESLTASLISEHQPQHGSGRLLVEKASNVTFFPSPRCEDGGSLSAESLAALDALERDGEEYFAVIIEPIQWRNSVHAVPLEFLRRLRDVCTRKSICLIFDEIHNGFGYTGTISFAENSGVCPDIAAMSKGLTSGHGSLAIMVAKRSFSEIDGPFAGKSNAADMTSLVAIDAVLDRLLGVEPNDVDAMPDWLPEELVAELRVGLLDTAYSRTVALVDSLFLELRRRFPHVVGASTGMGLVRGLVMLDEFDRPSEAVASAVAKHCLANGVYVRQAGTALFVKPSLVLSPAEADIALDGLSRTLAQVTQGRSEEARSG